MDQLIKTEDIDIVPDVIPVKTYQETVSLTDDATTKPIKSPNYKLGSTGWRLNSNGVVEFNNIYGVTALAGSFYVAASSGGATTTRVDYKNGIITAIV